MDDGLLQSSLPVVVITRPVEDGWRWVNWLLERGLTPVLAPMAELLWHEEAWEGMRTAMTKEAGYGWICTSKHAIRALAMLTPLRHQPLWAVGRDSEALAQELGFVDVHAGYRDAAVMLEAFCQQVTPEQGQIYYGAGRETSMELAGHLRARGYLVTEYTLYSLRYRTTMPAAMGALWEARRPAILLCYSARMAQQLVQMLRTMGPGGEGMPWRLMAISEAVAQQAQAWPWQEIRVAEHPDGAGMFTAVEGWMEV